MRRLIKLPIHCLMLLSGEKSFASNPVLGSPRLNRMGLHNGRKRLAHGLSRLRRWFATGQCAQELASKIDANGYVVLTDFLPREEFVQLKNDVLCLQQRAVEMVQPPATTRRFNLDAHNTAHLPALNSLLKNRNLLGLLRHAAGYGGAPIVAVQCIHTDADAPGQRHDPQTDWHTDTFQSTAKAWLFLHEVAANAGPFAYVPGSHGLTPARMGWEQHQSEGAATHPNVLHARGSFRASLDELAAMGFGPPVLGEVPANTLVVADTSGFHRRTPSDRPTVRVEIYLSLRRNPFFAGLYPSLLGLPLVRQWWANWAYNLYEWQTRRGVSTWHPCPRAGLDEDEKHLLR
jgi:hypothetical protein